MPESKGERFSLKPKYFIGISVVITYFLLLSRIYHTTNMPKNTLRFEPGSIEYQNLHPAVGGGGAHGYSGGVAESAAQASGIPMAIEGSGAPVMHFLLTAELPGGAFGGQQKNSNSSLLKCGRPASTSQWRI